MDGLNVLEAIASSFGLIATWFYAKQNNLSWPLGLVMVCIYTYIFFQVKLYSAMGLQVVFIFLQLYGWYEWVFDKEIKKAHAVFRASSLLLSRLFILWAVSTVILVFVMMLVPDADLVVWDAANATMCLIAQWMMAKKYLECWILWAVNDALYAAMYYHKTLYFTSVLNILFLLISIKGYLEWRDYLHEAHPEDFEADQLSQAQSSVV